MMDIPTVEEDPSLRRRSSLMTTRPSVDFPDPLSPYQPECFALEDPQVHAVNRPDETDLP